MNLDILQFIILLIIMIIVLDIKFKFLSFEYYGEPKRISGRPVGSAVEHADFSWGGKTRVNSEVSLPEVLPAFDEKQLLRFYR